MFLMCGAPKLFYAEMVFLHPASLTYISTNSFVYGFGTGLLLARADPDHGRKSDVGCGAAF
jgi:hypothetical protein